MGLLQEAGLQQEAPQEGGAAGLIKKATQILYSENFDSMVKMFEKYGKEGFAEAMGIAVNSTIDRLEKDEGVPLDPQTAVEVGVSIFEMIIADLHEGGVLPDIDKNDVILAIEEILRVWGSNHQDQVNPEEVKGMIEQMAAQMAQTGELQGEQPQAQVQPNQAQVQPNQVV